MNFLIGRVLVNVGGFDPQTNIDVRTNLVQCPLDIATLDKAAALAIATSTPATNLRQYINSDLGYYDLKF